MTDARRVDNNCAAAIGKMSGLRALQLTDADLLSGEGVVSLSQLDLVEELAVNGTLLTDHDILPLPTCLPRVRSLSFAGSRVRRPALQHCSAILSLAFLCSDVSAVVGQCVLHRRLFRHPLFFRSLRLPWITTNFYGYNFPTNKPN